MQAERPRPVKANGRNGIYDRILGDIEGAQDEALVFAVSSVIRELASPEFAGGSVFRVVSTERATYSVCGSFVYEDARPQPVVVVHSSVVPNKFPSRFERLRERFRLTRKEISVALLLAEQKSNDEIADALFISSHTARHHTQSVLSKLGVRSRREVASLLSTTV